MASAVARAYKGGLGAELPVGSGGRALVKGAKPSLKLKHFWFSDIQWKPQIFPLFIDQPKRPAVVIVRQNGLSSASSC